jgi:hypothetical protein
VATAPGQPTLGAGRESRPAQCGRSWPSPPPQRHLLPRPHTASARRRRTGRPPLGRSSLQALQDHDHRQDRWRYRAAPIRLEQVREQLRREQPGPLPSQEPVHRALRQRRLTSWHQRWADQGDATDGQGSQRHPPSRRRGARSLPAQRITDDSDTEQRPPSRGGPERRSRPRPTDGTAPLGPRWVRAATVRQGHQRSSTVTYGPEEPQLINPPAHTAAMMPVGDSDCGHEGPGWRRAADGQQPVFVTTGEPASKSWRIMTAHSAIDGR